MNRPTLDNVISQFDLALKTLHGVGHAQRPYPPHNCANMAAAASLSEAEPNKAEPNKADNVALSHAQRKHSAGLMRVNHVGEVCAQALYAGQSLTARSALVKQFNQHAALEERDHLLWTARRLHELHAKPSKLNPLWYAGAWGLGVVAGALGDRLSLAFVQETEAQVEAHLHSHETQLPSQDSASLAIVSQMKHDEAAHGAQALALGAATLPKPVRWAMRASAKVMTSTAYYV